MPTILVKLSIEGTTKSTNKSQENGLFEIEEVTRIGRGTSTKQTENLAVDGRRKNWLTLTALMKVLI